MPTFYLSYRVEETPDLPQALLLVGINALGVDWGQVPCDLEADGLNALAMWAKVDVLTRYNEGKFFPLAGLLGVPPDADYVEVVLPEEVGPTDPESPDAPLSPTPGSPEIYAAAIPGGVKWAAPGSDSVSISDGVDGYGGTLDPFGSYELSPGSYTVTAHLAPSSTADQAVTVL